MSLQDRLTVACLASLAALALYGAVGGKLLYYGVWLPTAAVALYYIGSVAIEGVAADAR